MILMISMPFSRVVCATNSNRQRSSAIPTVLQRSSPCSKRLSGSLKQRGSLNTDAAWSKWMPCLRQFAFSFSSSHSNSLIRPMYHKAGAAGWQLIAWFICWKNAPPSGGCPIRNLSPITDHWLCMRGQCHVRCHALDPQLKNQCGVAAATIVNCPLSIGTARRSRISLHWRK